MQVLIAEDDSSVAGALAHALERIGHGTTVVARGSDVLLQHHQAALLLLDLGLLDTDGFEVLRRLRLISDIPVIVITASSDERSTVRALRAGADDYLVKPVRLHELLARIEAVTRRRTELPCAAVVTVGELKINLDAHQVDSNGTALALTATEFAMLAVLARQVGVAVSREQILDEVWGDAYAAQSRAFDVHLAQLRQKLPDPGIIVTIRGFGYRMEHTG